MRTMMSHRRSQPGLAQVWRIDTFVLSVAYTGLVPALHGGVTAAACIPMLVHADRLLPVSPILRGGLLVAFIAALIFGGVALLRHHVRDGHYDRKYVSLDEVLGMTVASSPLLLGVSLEHGYLVAFALFCFFDSTKVLGVGAIDRIDRPENVFFDDLLAGVYAAVSLVAVAAVM